MANAQKKEQIHVTVFQANKWATLRHEIKNACNQWTDEEIRLHECVALTSWENR